MNKEKWEEFTNKVNSNLTQNKVPLNSDTTNFLETNWHKIQISLINAALEHIPNKKQKIQNFHNTYSPKATSLHNNLKLLGQIIRQVKSSLNNNSTILPNISQQINEINQQQDLQIKHPPTNPNMILTWINNTQKEWKTLHKAHDLENYTYIQQQITTATEKRCQALQTQPTKMINSILD